MVGEADKIVLRMLREIRAKQGEHDTRFEGQDERFDRLDKHGDEMREYMRYALGVGAMHDIKLREIDARREEEAARNKRRDETMAELERRLRKVEEKSD